MSTTKLSDNQIDILSEMANIGCNNALTALSKLLKKETRVSGTNVRFLSLNQFSQFLQIETRGPLDLSIVADTSVAGDLKGSLLIVFPKDTAILLTSSMKKTNSSLVSRQGATKGVFDLNSLQKVAGVLTEKYVEAVRKFVDLDIHVSSEIFMITTYGRSIVDVIMSTMGLDVRGNLLVMTDAGFYIVGHEENECKVLFALGVDSTIRLLEKMKRKISVSGRC